MNQPELFPTATLSFTDFWELFPRKTAKQISQKAWARLSITDQKKAFRDCVKRYKDTPKKFIPHASTYLNQQRWDEEIITEEPTSNSPPQIHSQSYKAYVQIPQGGKSDVGKDALRKILGRKKRV